MPLAPQSELAQPPALWTHTTCSLRCFFAYFVLALWPFILALSYGISTPASPYGSYSAALSNDQKAGLTTTLSLQPLIDKYCNIVSVLVWRGLTVKRIALVSAWRPLTAYECLPLVWSQCWGTFCQSVCVWWLAAMNGTAVREQAGLLKLCLITTCSLWLMFIMSGCVCRRGMEARARLLSESIQPGSPLP